MPNLIQGAMTGTPMLREIDVSVRPETPPNQLTLFEACAILDRRAASLLPSDLRSRPIILTEVPAAPALGAAAPEVTQPQSEGLQEEVEDPAS